MLNLKLHWQKFNNAQQKILKIIGIICLVLFCFYWGKNLLTQYFIHQFLKKPPVIGITPAKIRPLHHYYHTTGQLKAIRLTTLSVQSPGVIQKIWVKPGQLVKKNQMILELKTEVEKAHLNSQKADYSLQKQLFKQQEELYKKSIISKTQFLEAETRLKKALALYQEAKAQVRQKYIRAPFSGIVGIPEIQVGDYLNPGQKPVLSLQQSQKLYLDFYVPEQYYSSIHIRDAVFFSTEQNIGKLYNATVVGIEPASQHMAHTIWVRALVDNHQKMWIPGLSVHLKLQILAKSKSIFVPNQCIQGSVHGPIVYTAHQKMNPQTHHLDWWIEQKNVGIGLTQKKNTEITYGLNGQEFLVSSGTQKVHDQSFAILKKAKAS